MRREIIRTKRWWRVLKSNKKNAREKLIIVIILNRLLKTFSLFIYEFIGWFVLRNYWVKSWNLNRRARSLSNFRFIFFILFTLKKSSKYIWLDRFYYSNELCTSWILSYLQFVQRAFIFEICLHICVFVQEKKLTSE